MGLAIAGDLFSEIFRIRKLMRKTKLLVAVEGGIIRLVNDMGRLIGNLAKGRFWSIGERFDYFATGESIAFERRIAGMKFLIFLLSFLLSVFIL